MVDVSFLTKIRQYFHTDDADIVGLLCIARALEGGESDIVSAHHVYNALRRERRDVLKTLIEPIWYFYRQGEVGVEEEPYIRTSVFYLKPDGAGRVFCKYVYYLLFRAHYRYQHPFLYLSFNRSHPWYQDTSKTNIRPHPMWVGK